MHHSHLTPITGHRLALLGALVLSLAFAGSSAAEDVNPWAGEIIGTCVNGKKIIKCSKECSEPQIIKATQEEIDAAGGLNALCLQRLGTGSIIDNVSLNHIHQAFDWSNPGLSPSASGCGSCGGGTAAASLMAPVPTLTLERRHRFRDMTEVSSFGPGIFCNYDISLMLQPNGTGSRVRVFDPALMMPLLLDDGTFGDTRDGIFRDGLRPNEGDRVIADLRLTTDYNGAGSVTSAIETAKGALLTTLDGRKLRFDAFSLLPLAGTPVSGASPWVAMDVGRTGRTGQTTCASGTFTQAASGADVWSTGDSFHYCYQALRDNGSLTLRIASQTQTDVWAKTGVMIRESLSAASRNAFVATTPASGLTFQARPFKAGTVALKCQGQANGGTTTSAFFKVLDRAATPILITAGTRLSYWIHPLDEHGRHVAIDFHCTDGTTLRASGAKDQRGYSLAPAAGHGGTLPLNTWSEVRCTIGAVATLVGKRIDRIDVGFDRAGAIGGFAAFVDDVTLSDPASGSGVITGFEAGEPQPTWQNAFDTDFFTGNPSNVVGIPPATAAECGLRSGELNHGGMSYQIAGRTGTGTKAPCWLRLTRAGSLISAASSSDNVTWTSLGEVIMPTGRDVFVGLGSSAHLYAAVSTVTATNLILTGTPTPAAEWPATGLGNDRRGRLTQIVDRNGYATTLTYRYNPLGHPATDAAQQTAIAASPERQFQLNTITDAQGRSMTFSYLASQVSARWAVGSITLPNTKTLTYAYTNGALSKVTHPDGTASTFAASLDPATGCTLMNYFEAAETGTHRRKTVYLTSNVTEYVHGSYDSVYSQSSLLVRAVVNGNGEITYANLTDPKDITKTVIFEQGTLREDTFTSSRYYLPGWTRDPAKGYDGIVGVLEPVYVKEDLGGNWANYHKSTPAKVTTESGKTIQFAYDQDTYPTRATYSDGTSNEATFNAFKQPTRTKDRNGRIKRFTYDSRGNCTRSEDGLIVQNGVDVPGPDYAKRESTYHPAGDPNQYLKASDTDANGNRTDYLYDVQRRLWKIIAPADVAGGARPTTVYTYDSAGRVATITDAGNRTLTYHYDGRDRVDRLTYADGTTESFVYGAAGTPDANLLKRKVDRNGVATDYTYDAAGRRIRTQSGAIIVAGAPIVAASSLAVETLTYVPRTELVQTRTLNGNTTTYAYDHHNRLVSTSHQPRQGMTLTERTEYLHNLPWRKIDAHGRNTWTLHDGESRPIRTVRQLVAGTSIPGLSADAKGLLVDAVYKLYSVGVKKCMENKAHATTAGAAVVQMAEDGQTDQQWMLVANGDATYRFVNQESGLVMDIAGASTAEGAAVVLNPWDGRNGERFNLIADGQAWKVVSVLSGKVLEVSGGSTLNNAAIVQRTDAGRTTQRWALGLIRLPAAAATLPRLASTAVNPSYVIEDRTYDPMGRVASTIDGRGIVTTFAYDAEGRLVNQIQAARTVDAIKTEYRYDAQGNQTQVVMPRSFVYDLPSNTFSAAPTGEIATVTTYTGRNLPATVTEAMGTADAAVTSFTYSPTGKVLTTRDPRTYTVTNVYATCCDRLQDVFDQKGFKTHYEYEPAGAVISITDPNGNITVTRRDSRGRTVSTMTGMGAGETTTYLYDENLTDGVGIDAVPARVAGLGFGPGCVGSAVQVTDPTGVVAIEIRDGVGRTVRRIDGAGNPTTVTYDVLIAAAPDAGLVETFQTDAMGRITRARSDAAGRTRVQIDALGKRTTSVFDNAGNRIRVRDPKSVGQDCIFDNLNRDVACTDTAGATTRRVYDPHGNVVTTVDAMGKYTFVSFDARDRKIAVKDRLDTAAKPSVTRFTYDRNGNLLTITDAELRVTTYAYDERNLLVTELYPKGTATGWDPVDKTRPNTDRRSYAYDPARRLKTRTDQAGAVTTYEYDRANRLITRRYPDNRNDTFSYDAASRLTAALSGRYGTNVRRAYAAGRLAAETQSLDGVDRVVGYAYDALNRVTAVTHPDGTVARRDFTERGQLKQVWLGSDSVAIRSYDESGRLITTAYANGRTETRTYRTGDHLLASIVTPGVASFTYGFDGNKRKTAETDGTTAANSQTFAYDSENRLTLWKRPSATDEQSWNLSLVGDWTSMTRNGEVETRIHSDVHETASLKRGTQTFPLKYDANGNLTQDENGAAYLWDYENRLKTAAIKDGAMGLTGIARYRYDALGRRLQKIVWGRAITYVHDGAQVIQELGGQAQAWGDERSGDGAAPAAIPGEGTVLGQAKYRINMQAESALVPDGFQADKGKTFGARTNGLSYGWDQDRRSLGRVRGESPIPECDTLVVMGVSGSIPASRWRLALPNGRYPVAVVMGDASYRDQTNHITINGQAFTDPDPWDGKTGGYLRGDFDGYLAEVDVVDGYLAIAPSTSGVSQKLCFVEVGPKDGHITDADRARMADLVSFATSQTGAMPYPQRSNEERRYVYGSYVDEPLFQINGGTKSFIHANHLYSVAALTDSTGALQAAFNYDAYGQRTTRTVYNNRAFTTIGFTGRTVDDETGLMYFRARQYSTALGRFIKRDPARYNDGMNLYRAYFIANYLDPTGLTYTERIRLVPVLDLVNQEFLGMTYGKGPTPRGEDRIVNVDDKECCAKIEKTRSYDLIAVTELPYGGLGSFYTKGGLQAIKEHEAKRRLVYKKAYQAYVRKIQSAESSIPEKCGVICKKTPGAAKTALSIWLEALRSTGLGSYSAYVVQEQMHIGDEQFMYDGEVLIEIIASSAYTVADPAELSVPECPLSE